MSKKVSIIDYGMSNLLSICRAFEHIGAQVQVIDRADDVLQSDYLVLPGVGAFPDGMKELEKRSLIDPVKEFAKSGKPLLGVCLGMQMLLGKSHEHIETAGLNMIEGEVLALPKYMQGFKVPNINWHSADWNQQDQWEQSVFRGTKNGACFYFVHSYYAKPANEHILSTTRFGDLKFTSAVKKDNITGTQFHPEKSGEEGLKLLVNFIGN
jgi:imidazole glycerol-phosphate synthase subunit HisH